MNSSEKEKAIFRTLFIKSIDGQITEEEIQQFNTLLSSYPNLEDYYIKSVQLQVALREIRTFSDFQVGNEPNYENQALWKEFAEYEKIAPHVEILDVPEEPQDEEPIRIKKVPPRVSKFSIISLVLSSAALVFVIVYAQLVSMRQGVEVATLTDSVNATWADPTFSIHHNSRLFSNQLFTLSKGFISIKTDQDVMLTIEGPAEFEMTSDANLKMNYGRIYAQVAPQGMGFAVNTPNSKIIDLGTEFGVEVGFGGTTELHVIKGKTTLIFGVQKQKASILVAEGAAKKVSGIDNSISDITCDFTKFARKIGIGESKQVWRGESLSLASIVAGRDGFQEVNSLTGINPATGQFTSSIISNNRASKKTYNSVPDSDFIDGVFVPDGGQGPVLITSGGHTFECPNTKGLFTHEIAAYKGSIESQYTTIEPAVFNGRKYENESIVMLHSNIGITFDLQAIRKSKPGLELKSFTAWGGLTEAIKDSKDQPDVDFWILIDGQVKYERKMLKIEDGTISFDIPLNPQDRFLTLIVTDGLRSEEDKRVYPFGNDFFYLINPELSLETISNR